MTETINTSVTAMNICVNNESWGMAVTTIASLLIVIGNLLVMIVLIKHRTRHFRPIRWFLIQLAFADIIVGLTVLWIGTMSPLLLDTVSLKAGILTYGTLASATSTSTLGVLFIALDRHFYILNNSNYKNIINKRKVVVSIVIAELLPLAVFVFAPILGWNCISQCSCLIYNIEPSKKYCFGDNCSQMMTPFRKETVFVGGLCLLLVLLTATALYLHVFLKVHSQSTKLRANSSRRKSELRMAKTMVIVLGGFILTTGPLALTCIISFFYNERSLHYVMRILVVVSIINSILNPIFYFWRIPEMKSSLLKMICPKSTHPRNADDAFNVKVTLSLRRLSVFSIKSSGRLPSTSSASFQR